MTRIDGMCMIIYFVLKKLRSKFRKYCQRFANTSKPDYAKIELFDDELTTFVIQIPWYTYIVILMFYEKECKVKHDRYRVYMIGWVDMYENEVFKNTNCKLFKETPHTMIRS